MPKIIENLPEKLLAETRRQVSESGYGAVTVRGVAAACGVGVGTVYNYFPSKDVLIASFMLEDWNDALDAMRVAFSDADARAVLSAEYDGLTAFLRRHERLFSDPEAIRTFSQMSHKRHDQLRAQLAEPLRKTLAGRAEADFLADFLTEALLAWTMAGTDKTTLFSVLDRLL